MSRRAPADFSFDDLLPLLARCGMTAPAIADPERFTPADYRDSTGTSYWHGDTVRAWVTSDAIAEIVSRPRVLNQIAMQLQRRFNAVGELQAGATRALALQLFARARLAEVLPCNARRE